ncbi:YtpI family protein [Caldalkalibacillus uzonensis]|nr:YtpI family protein [Caldalkalibacillus uzonensis]
MIDMLLMFTVVIAASFSVYYSFKTRSFRKQYYEIAAFKKSKVKTKKKEQEAFNMMKYYNAKTNIAMGTLLTAMAVIQFMFPEPTGWRIGVGAAFLALGLFNLIMGIRHYRTYATKVYNGAAKNV